MNKDQARRYRLHRAAKNLGCTVKAYKHEVFINHELLNDDYCGKLPPPPVLKLRDEFKYNIQLTI